MHHNRARLGNNLCPGLRVCQSHLIRVGSRRQGGHAQIGLQAGLVPQQPARIKAHFIAAVQRLAGNFQPAQRGLFSSGVGIQRQHHAAAEALEQPDLVFGQRRAHRRDGVGEPCLMQHNHIQVAFHNHHLVGRADRLACLVQSVQQAPLIKQGRLWRIEKFGHVIGV